MITVITIVKNEEIMLPFFLRHYECIGDRIIINDNGSCDRTRTIAAKHEKVQVVQFDTNGELRDSRHTEIKNSLYRTIQSEWFIVVDCDEFIWHPVDVRSYLLQCAKVGISLPRIDGFQMLGSEVPKEDGKLRLTDRIKVGIPDSFYSKRAVFHRRVSINYGPGAHVAHPEGEVVESEKAELKLLHYRWLSEEYSISKARNVAKTMSQENLNNGWGCQYLNLDSMREWYRNALTKSFSVIP